MGKLWSILILLVLLGLAACAPSYPLGMSEAEWNALTPEQQQEARVADAELKRAKAEQKAAEANARALEQRNKLIEQYRRAGKGDIAECQIIPPENAPAGLKVRPSEVTLVRGEDRRLTLTKDFGSPEYLWARRGSGGDIELCGSTSSGSGPAGSCDRITSLSIGFGQVAKKEIVWAPGLRNGTFECQEFKGSFGPSGIPPHLL